MSIKTPIRSSIQRAAFYVALGICLGGCGWLPKPKTDAASFVPHTLDVVQTAAVISDGGIELNPVGWPGVTFVKIGTEIIARQQRNAGHADLCYALALGGRSGGWAGFSATAAGLLGATAIGMVAAGLAAPVLMYAWTAETARITCYETTNDPFDVEQRFSLDSFSGR